MKCQNCGYEIPSSGKFCPKCGTKVVEQTQSTPIVVNTFSHDISNIWPEWQLEKQLGRGSYGIVYQAVRRDNNVESHAAIKVISIPTDASEVDSLRSEGLDMDGTRTYFKGIVDDFISEIQLMESLKGVQNIVSVEDYKVVEKPDGIGWDIYIRMELLTSFNAYICDKKLTEEDVIKLGCDICTALEICDKRNIIHRDIKPENIFINDFGDFKLGDFGVARKLENMTGGLSQKGTYNYMAPEVANSNEYDARVDTYSLGIVLYRLLNGNRLPFLDTEKQLLNPNERRNAVERRIKGEDLPTPSEASSAMANLILRACAFDPAQRFMSATEMKQALISVREGTYKPIVHDSDSTMAVRRAKNEGSGTISVRKAPIESNQNHGRSINTFGDKPKKKKTALIVILCSIIAILLVGAIVFIGWTLANRGDNEDSQDNKPGTTQTTLSNDENKETTTSNQETTTSEQETTTTTTTPVVDKYQEYIDKADELASQNKFDEAVAELNTAEQLFGAHNKITTKRTEIIKKKGLYALNQFESSSDYKSAIKYIDETMQDYVSDADIVSKRNLYVSKYRTQILSQADAAFKSSGYEKALEILNSSTDVLPSDSEINAAITKYSAYAPVSIASLDYFTGSEYSIKNSIKDNLGVVHDNVTMFNWSDNVYKLNKQYSTLSGLWFQTYDYKNDWRETILEIYGDGVLLYSGKMSRGIEPINLNLNVSGVSELKISWALGVSGYENDYCGIADFNLTRKN